MMKEKEGLTIASNGLSWKWMGVRGRRKEGWLLLRAKRIYQWWRLSVSPAKSNESPMLELSGAWEPLDRAGAWGFDPGT